MEDHLHNYLLILGDNSMILGHRLSELCGHGPSLETDIALTNISLDLFGQVRNIFQYVAKRKGSNLTEDNIAYDRKERAFKNTILVEQENKDFAHVIARQYFFDVYHSLLLESLTESKDEMIAAIAQKSIKESKYHLRFSSEWMKRLGDGTEISHEKLKVAVDHLYPYIHEFFHETEAKKVLKEQGVAADLEKMKAPYYEHLQNTLSAACLDTPDVKDRITRGKYGYHTELMGFLLAEFQFTQRAYPNMEW